MAAELNELFEQGITHCGELGDAVDAAMDAIDEATEQAKELAERVVEEGTEAHQHMRDLVARLEKAEHAVEDARKEAGGSLDGLAGRAADLKTEVAALLERVKKSATQLEEQRSRIDDSLTAQMATVQGDFTELAQNTLEVEVEASRRLERAGEAITRFRSAIDEARDELQQKREAWTTALDGLETTAQEQTSAWVAGLQALLQRQATAMVAAANVMVDRHNEAMDDIKNEFAEQAPQELASALEPVQVSLRGLAAEASAREQALCSRVAELEEAINGHAPALDGLSGVLEAVTELS